MSRSELRRALERGRTVDQVGRALNLTRERIRQSRRSGAATRRVTNEP